MILHEKRDCITKKVKWSEVKVFLNKYHNQGIGRSTRVNYGLYHGDELISVATFAPSRYKADWEWVRLCYKKGVIVKGGTKRLFKSFFDEYSGSVVSYQFDFSKDFEELGFKLLKMRISNLYINPVTGKCTWGKFINDKKDLKLQEYLKNNPNKTALDYFGYTVVQKNVACYTWYRQSVPIIPIGYIYKITSPEGRCYVGAKRSSVFVESYWSSSRNKKYWADLENFGKEAFRREILEWCYTLSELYEREIYWIKKSKATIKEGGYNIYECFKP